MFTNKETSLLFNLRSQCVNEFKANFYLHSCPFCKTHSDTQEHALYCTTLRKHMDKDILSDLDSVSYNDIFGDINSQHKITQIFSSIIQTREQLRAPPQTPAYPGHNTGPGG